MSGFFGSESGFIFENITGNGDIVYFWVINVIIFVSKF